MDLDLNGFHFYCSTLYLYSCFPFLCEMPSFFVAGLVVDGDSILLTCCFLLSGCADFVPSCIDTGSQFEAASYESFGEVVRKASAWIRQQTSVRLTNVQSISYKLQHGIGSHNGNYGGALM